MRATHLLQPILLVATLSTLPFTTSCQTSEVHDRASETADSVVSVGGVAGQTQLHLDSALNSLEEIAATATRAPTPAFNSFVDSFDAFGRNLADLAQQRRKLDSQSTVWFGEFERQNAAIQDPALRKKGEQRLIDFRTQVGAVSSEVDGLFSNSLALQTRLKDLRVFLGNDLTATGIASVSDRIASLAKDGRQVAAGLGKLSKSSNELADSMRAARVPAAR